MGHEKEYALAIKIAGKVDASLGSSVNKVSSLLNGGLAKAGKVALSAVTGAAMAAGAAVAGIGAYSVSVGADFEAGMSKVQAISNASAAELEQLSAKAKEMGATTKFSATQSAEALQYMAMAGWKTEQMTAGLPGIMNLAAASGEDLALTSDIVTDALTAMGLQASDSAHFADVLAAAASNSNTNVAMMGETFKYAGPVAGALGYSIEDTALAIGLMANSGIKAEMAGTALRGMLTNLAKPSDQVQGYMDELGLSLTDVQGNVRPLNELLVDMQQKFAKLTDAQQAEYAAGIAGKNAMSGMLALVNAAPEDFEKLSNAVANADGTAKRMADTMNDNLHGQLTLLGSNAEGVGIKIYESFEGPLKAAVKVANDSVTEISESISGGELDRSLHSISTATGEVIETGSELAVKILPAAIKGLAWIIDHGNVIVGGLKAAAAAAVTFKSVATLGSLTKSWTITSRAVTLFATGQSAAAVKSAVMNGYLSMQHLVVGVLTKKISLATAAQAAWNAVSGAHPLALLTAAIAGAVVFFGHLAAATQEANSETVQFDKKQQALHETLEEQKRTREELREVTANNIKHSAAEIDAVQGYIKELDLYTDAEGRVNDEHKERAKWLADEINRLIPNAVEALNDEEGKRYKIVDSINAEILAKRKAALLDAMREEYGSVLQSRTEAELAKTEALNQQNEAREKLNEKIEKQQKLEDGLKQFSASSGYMQSEITIDGQQYTEKSLREEIETNKNDISIWQLKQATAAEKVETAQSTIDSDNDFLNNYDSATSAETPEQLSAIEGKFNARQNLKEYAGQGKEDLRKTLQEHRDTLRRRKQEIAQEWDSMSEANRQRADQELAQMQTEVDGIAEQIGAGAAAALDAWETSIETGKPDINTAMKLIAEGVLSAADVAQEMDSLGQVAMHNYGKGISEQQSAVQNAMQQGGRAVIAQAQTIADGILVASDICAQMKRIGENIAEGLASGIASRQVAAVQSAVNMMNAVVQKSKETVDTHSPSRVFRNQIGRMLPAGLALGIYDGENEVKNASARMAQAAIQAADLTQKISFNAAPDSQRKVSAVSFMDAFDKPASNSGSAYRSGDVIFSPTIQVHGENSGSVTTQIRETLSMAYEDFVSFMERYDRDKRRTQFRYGG